MTAMAVLYILIGLAGIVFLIYLTGLLLPAERVVSRQAVFNVAPETLFRIVTDNTDWQYRRSLKDLVILESDKGMEVWDEISHDGTVIHFRTKEKRPNSFYSFDMQSNLFTGHWTGEFEPQANNKTLFTATEHIRVKNPFIKTLSYLFFNIGKLMDTYINDLHTKVENPFL